MLYSLDRPSARVIGRIDDYDYDDDYDDDDTVELELNEAAIQALTEAAALALAASDERAEPRLTPAAEAPAQQTPAARQVAEVLKEDTPAAAQVAEAPGQQTPAVRQVAVSFGRPPRKSRRFALGFGMAAAVAGLLGGLTYLATAGARHPFPIVADSGFRPTVARHPQALTSAPTSVPASPPALAPAPASPATPDAPVRFKNPFDASEVFEFPAGTSRAEMRDAVAELLSQRALERQSLFSKRPRRNTKIADPNASETASSVTSRS